MAGKRIRLAVIVSHPIQYYVPLYRRLAQRNDIAIKVFFTWHAGNSGALDHGFRKAVAWDIPLTEGYEFELISNVASNPGTHRFWGLRSPSLIPSVMSWKPDAVHLTGYASASHASAMRALCRKGIPVLFRGDSHLLCQPRGIRWQVKRAVLRRVYRWVDGCLYVGRHNADYYREFGVPEARLFYCPHSIEVERFAEPNEALEKEADAWCRQLRIDGDRKVVLFAGKFEKVKQPLALMRAFRECAAKEPRLLLIMVGDGELGAQVVRIASESPNTFRVLPFQNQSRMPIVYRLGRLFVLPSICETWGLAVNEAIASGRPVIVSDKVGCAADLVAGTTNGSVFRANDWRDFQRVLNETFLKGIGRDDDRLRLFAKRYDVSVTEDAVIRALYSVLNINE